MERSRRSRGRSLHSNLAVSGATEPAPFTELWTLSPTGQPPSQAGLRCPMCGGENAFTDLHCRFCGAGVARPAGPWRIRALQFVAQGAAETPFAGGPSEDWQWAMQRFIC